MSARETFGWPLLLDPESAELVLWIDPSPPAPQSPLYGMCSVDDVPGSATVVEQEQWVAFTQTQANVADSQMLNRLQETYDEKLADLVNSGFTTQQAAALIGARP